MAIVSLMVVMGISITQAKAATVTYDVDATYVESYTSNTAAVDGTFALDTDTEAITPVDITLTGPSAFTFTTADIQTASYSPSAGNNTTVLIAASATDDLGCAAERGCPVAVRRASISLDRQALKPWFESSCR